MKAVVILFGMLLSFQVFAGFACDLAERGVEVTTQFIASKFECKNDTQIKEDIGLLIQIDQLCEENRVEYMQSPVMCTIIAKSTAIYVASKIPEAWECNERVSTQYLDRMIYNVCLKATEE